MVVMVVIMFSFMLIIDKISLVDESTSLAYNNRDAIIHTDVDMDSLIAVAGSPYVNFTLNNDESEKLWDFQDFDVIVDFDGTTSGLREKLSYEGTCPGQYQVPSVGYWCVYNISGYVEPGVLNGGESAIIRTHVSENLANGDASVSLNTDRGIIATLPFFKPVSALDLHSNPPTTCEAGYYGRTFLDTDTGISYMCDSTRDKWLSTETITLWGEEGGTQCSSGDDPDSSDGCNVDWGDNLGPESSTDLGLYIPYNMTLTAYGISMLADDCTSGTYDLEYWGTGSNTDDASYSLQFEVTGLSDETENANDVSVDVEGDQYTLWGLDNNCGEDINDFNIILYFKYHHDDPYP